MKGVVNTRQLVNKSERSLTILIDQTNLTGRRLRGSTDCHMHSSTHYLRTQCEIGVLLLVLTQGCMLPQMIRYDLPKDTKTNVTIIRVSILLPSSNDLMGNTNQQ